MKIDFKQPKYVFPLPIWLFSLFIAYQIDQYFFAPPAENVNPDYVKSDKFNTELPTPSQKKKLDSKFDNMSSSYGRITDGTLMGVIDDDIDSIKKKEEYHSRFSEEELEAMEKKLLEEEEAKKLKQTQEKLRQSAERGKKMMDDGFEVPLTDEERSRALDSKRRKEMEELERQLGLVREDMSLPSTKEEPSRQAVAPKAVVQDEPAAQGRKDSLAVRSLAEDAEAAVVVKKKDLSSDYFYTLADEEQDSRLIKAIVDEEVKASDGSRVRLRLLDDIEAGDLTLKKGSCLYATLSGMGSERVKGKVSSVLIGDELVRISLNIYDTDGQEGLYVPGSVLRETVQDAASAAMQGTQNLNEGSYGSNGFGQWASQATQNVISRTTNAVSKVFRKKKVRIKYGTQVYLVNGSGSKKK